MNLKTLLISIFIAFSFNAQSQSNNDISDALKYVIGEHLESNEKSYLGKLTINDYYPKDGYLIVEGKFYHSGTVSNTWKYYTAKINAQGDYPKVIKVCYWKYWVLTGEYDLICTDGSSYIDPKPSKNTNPY